MKCVTTPLPPNSTLVRILLGDGPEYDRMIVVTEEEDGDELFLQGWIGKPLTVREWREAAAEEFPKASWVRYLRLRKDGSSREVRAPLTGTQ
jgi:hypothetical protein